MKRFLKLSKRVAYLLVGAILFAFISLKVYEIYLKNSTKIETPNGISSLEEITLGGMKQWIFIRGEDKDNPVLIFLHGGPGSPISGISSSRKLDAELIKHFTIIHWDQRGAGKSYNSDIPVDSMSYDRLAEDCNELIDYVRNELNVQKVFLVGHSAGTLIGIKTIHKYPEKIHAYVGIGQIINDYEQQMLSYNFIVEEAEKSGDVKIQNAIKAIGSPPHKELEELYEKERYLLKYGAVIHSTSGEHFLSIMLSFLTSPEYSLFEGIKTFTGKGGYEFTMNAMFDEIKSVNLTEKIQSIKVPIYFFEGKYDMATPTILVESFYESLDAEKGKKLIIFENSAHMPMMEEKEKYEDLLINVVLKESQNIYNY